jgi:uncharacterized protein YecE (DUF72 family)
MWAYRPWVGRYLPSDTRPGDELAAYARFCNSVEGNTTFYALPEARTVARWAELAPPDFRFLFKVPRRLTHELRLRDAEDEMRELWRRFEPLGARVGAIFVQLPASFGPDQLDILDAFLAQLPSDRHGAVEVRHPDFSDGADCERALNDLLHRHDADRVLLDSRALFAGPAETRAELAAFRAKPRLPVRAVATSRHPVVRFIGQTRAEANPPYWARWVETVARWLLDGREPYFFVHTPDNEVSPELARVFHAAVAARVSTVDALPHHDQPALARADQSTLW